MSDPEEADQDWLLGFAEEPDSVSTLLRHQFPSKIGGRPAWLDPCNVPSATTLTCPVTGKPMLFVCQLYAAPPAGAPDDHAGAFHRSLFLFASPSATAISQAGGVAVLRSQLPRDNSFYAPDPSDDLLPPQLAPEQEQASLERDAWNVLQAERDLKGAGAGAAAPLMLQEWLLSVQPEADGSKESDCSHDGHSGSDSEPDACDKHSSTAHAPAQRSAHGKNDDAGRGNSLSTAAIAERLKEYQAAVARDGELEAEEVEGLDAVAKEQQSADDELWAHFQAVTSAWPGQVLRYCCDAGIEPMWGSSKPVPADIPNCERCGAPRRFEFQVLPQMLAFLGLDDTTEDGPDWLTIAVFTCSKSCVPESGATENGGSSAYAPEFAFVQPPFAGALRS